MIVGVDFMMPTVPWWGPGIAFWSDWSEFNMGSPVFIGWGALLGLLVQSISFGNSILTQKLLFSGILCANFTMFLFLKNHVTQNRLAAIAGAVLYAYSPMTQSNYGTGLIWGVAILPLTLNFVLDLLSPKGRISRALLLAFCLSLLMSYSPQVLPIFPAIILGLTIVDWRPRSTVRRLSLFLASAGLFFLMNLSSFFINVLVSSTDLAVTQVPIDKFWLNYGGFTAIRALTLTVLASGSNPVSTFLSSRLQGVVLPFVAFLSLLFAENASAARKALIISAGIILLDLLGFGLQQELSIFGVLLSIYRPFAAMRGPHSLLLYLSFLYPALVALSVSAIDKQARAIMCRRESVSPIARTRRLKRKTMVGLAITALIILSYFAYVPAYSAALHELTPAYPMPTSYPRIMATLQGSTEEFRYFWLPWTLTSNLVFASVYEPPAFFDPGGFPSTARYVNAVYSQIANSGTHNLGAWLAPGAVKYVVLILNTTEPTFTQWTMQGNPSVQGRLLVGNPQVFSQILSSQSDLTLLAKEDDYEIYENQVVSPLLSVSQEVIYVIGGMETIESVTQLPNFYKASPMLIFSEEKTRIMIKDASIIYIQDNEGTELSPSMMMGKIIMLGYDKPWLNGTTSFTTSPFATKQGENRQYSFTTRVPVGSNFSLSLRFEGGLPPESVSITIDGLLVPVRRITENWMESQRMPLDPGQHTIAMALSPELDRLFQGIVIHNGPSVTTLLSSSSESHSIQWRKKSYMEYSLHLESENPTFISLSESFDPRWHAYVQGAELTHFPAFSFANGFYLPAAGEIDVSILFKEEPSRAFGKTVSMATVFVGAFVLVLNYVVRRKRWFRMVHDLGRRATTSNGVFPKMPAAL
jgi:hypothetical protein